MTESPRGERVAAVLIGVLLVVTLAQRFTTESWVYNLWTDRDLVRSADALSTFPVSGAELSFGRGARIPGGFHHVLWGLPLWLGGGAEAVWRWVMALDTLGLLVIAGWLARRVGWAAGLTAAAVYLTRPATLDTLDPLWNPGSMGLFVAVAWVAALEAIASKDGRYLAAWGLATALGAQLHLSAGFLGLCLLPVVIAARPAGLGKGLAAGLGLAVLAYLPYLVVEARTGWPNTADLGSQPVVQGHGGRLGAFEVLGAMAGQVWTSDAQVPLLPGAVVLGLLANLPLLAVLAGPALAKGRDRWLLAGLVVPCTLGALWYAAEGRVDFRSSGDGRYVVAWMHGIALLAGLTTGWLAQRARVGGPLVLALAVVAATVTVPAEWQRTALGQRRLVRWAAFRDTLHAVADASGHDLAGVAGRMVILESGDRGRTWTWRARRGMGWLLHEEGTTFPGSLPGPCLAVFEGGAAPDQTPPSLDSLGQPLFLGASGVRELDRTELPLQHVLVRYSVDGGLCPTGMSQRYLLSSAEQAIADHARQVGPGEVLEIDGPGQARRVVARMEPPDGPAPPVWVAVDLLVAPERVRATLHANQLRGLAFNRGLFTNGRVDTPTLVVTDGTTEIDLPFAEGVVGTTGLSTPLPARAEVPSGTWTVRLRTAVLDTPREDPDDPSSLARAPVDLVLVDDLVVP